MIRTWRALLRLLALLAVTLLGWALPAGAQPLPSDHTYAMRYDLTGRVVGTMAPDPDGAGPLRYAAVRTSYDGAGRVVLVEEGELAAWRPRRWHQRSGPGSRCSAGGDRL